MADEIKPVELKLDTAAFAQRWEDITIDQLHQALDKYSIGRLDGALWKSIQGHLVKSGGDVQKVITQFLQYGRFIDMGVGRGVPIGGAGTKQFSAARNTNGTLRHYARKPKPWYSRTYYHQVQRFAEIFAKEFGKQVTPQVQDALTKQVNLAA